MKRVWGQRRVAIMEIIVKTRTLGMGVKKIRMGKMGERTSKMLAV